MNFRMAVETRNVLLNVLRDRIDAGEDCGVLKFYSGPQPDTADRELSASNKLLALLKFAHRSAADAADGTISFLVSQAPAWAKGKSSFARIEDSAGHVVFDCDVGDFGSGATIEVVDGVETVAGAPVRLHSFVVRIPVR